MKSKEEKNELGNGDERITIKPIDGANANTRLLHNYTKIFTKFGGRERYEMK
jgi:hypothetical protein